MLQNKRKMFVRASLAWAALLGCATAANAMQPPASDTADAAAVERMLAGESETSGAELERRIAAAAAHPLGSQQNPVRAAMPAGQRAYLQRLRCGDGQAPKFSRRGNAGVGVYGNFVDAFEVSCGGAAPREAVIFMDMYHRGHVEARPPSGFTIVAAR